MDFFDQIGRLALGSRLRRLTEKITEDAAQVFRLYGISMQPKWFPVFYVLSGGEGKTITAIAGEIGHTHPSVSRIVREMVKKGFAVERKDKTDGRKNVVHLSDKAKAVTEKIQDQYTDVNNAIAELSGEAANDLWNAIGEWEFLLEQKSLLKRVEEKKQERERGHIRIVSYEPRYRDTFRALNERWITTHFKLEEADRKALEKPEEYILKKGGHIVVALLNDQPVGVCALIRMDDPEYDFELAKMAVSPDAQGRGIGRLLGQAVIERAQTAGAAKIYLESNTVLRPAIQLYLKLGFQKVTDRPTPYERCNIQMALKLKPRRPNKKGNKALDR